LFESVLLPRQRGALVCARRRKRGLPETRRRGEALGGGAAAGGCWGRGSATGVSGAWVPPGAAARPRLPDGHRWAGAESRHDIRAGSCPRQASALAFEEAAPRGSSWWSPLTSATARVPRRSGVRLRKGLVKAPAGAEGAGEPQQHGAHGLSTRPRRSLRYGGGVRKRAVLPGPAAGRSLPRRPRPSRLVFSSDPFKSRLRNTTRPLHCFYLQ